jgi:cytochrome P450
MEAAPPGEQNQAGSQSAADLGKLLHRSLLEPENLLHPNDYYRALRQCDPVHFDQKAGMYLVSRYEELLEIVRDPITFSVGHAWNRTFAPEHFEEFKAILIRDGGGYFPDAIMTDPPQHTRVRRLLQAAFTPSRIKQLEPGVRRLTTELLDTLAERGRADGVSDFASRLTIGIMCQQLGLETADPEKIALWARVFTSIRSAQSREEMLEDARHFCDLQNFIIDRVRERQAQRRDDMISDLIYAHADGDERPTLSFEEVVSLTRALVIGGVETIGSALSYLLFLPVSDAAIANQLKNAAEDDVKLAHFVEELLRFEPPARGLYRATTREVQLGGKTIPEGAMLCLLFASANDDETVYERAREFDMGRKNLGRHLTFGGGIHMCVGMHLARMEVRVAAQEIARRLDDIRLTVPVQDIRFYPTLSTMAIESLPLSFGRQADS